MKRIIIKIFSITILISGAIHWTSCINSNMHKEFINIPENTKPGIYWYWLNKNVSKQWITKDLESLYDKGIGEVFIGNIYWDDFL